jgi:hypothetical protein
MSAAPRGALVCHVAGYVATIDRDAIRVYCLKGLAKRDICKKYRKKVTKVNQRVNEI